LDFPQYKVVNKEFQEKYFKYITEYPNAFLLFEKYLRTLSDPQNAINASQLIINYSRFSFVKSLYRNYVRFLLKLCHKFLNNENSGCYIYNIDRFPGLYESFLDSKSISIRHKPKSILSYFSLSKIDLHSIVSSNLKIIKFYKHLQNSNIDIILEQKDIMRYIDGVVLKEIELAALFLSKYKISSIISTSDDDPYMRILCSASKLSKTEINIIAHGYIGHPSLLTIAPIFGDKLFVWTQVQKDDLIKYLDEENANKIHFEGSPLIINRKRNFLKNKTVLFALGCLPVDKLAKDDALDIIEKYLSIILTFDFLVEIRFHPQDDSNYLNFIQKFQGKVFKSENHSVYDSIVTSEFVISTPTSIIIQAIHNGKNVFQIVELSNEIYYEQAVVVNLNNISDEIQFEIDGHSRALPSVKALMPESLVSKSCLFIR
jgi:hypothetical protein